jgi:hypothetical chaperone protein
LDYVENAKISLSGADMICQQLDFLSDCPSIITNVSDLIDAIRADVEKITISMNACLYQAGIKNTDIDLIILTGGSTQIPYVYNSVKNAFPNATISDSNKMASVGLGLAYDAINRFIKFSA